MSDIRSSARVVRAKDARNVVVYRDDAYAANWPYTGGMARFGDGEIAVGFTRLRCDNKDTAIKSVSHMHLDTWGELCLVRSKDDGETWRGRDVEVVVRKRDLALEFFQGSGPATAWDRDRSGAMMHKNWEPVDFHSPELLFLSNYIGEHMWCQGYDVRFWTMVLASEDRGRTWKLGPLVKKPRHMYSAWGAPSYVVRPGNSLIHFSDFIAKDRTRWPRQGIYADLLEEGGRHWGFHGILELEHRDATMYIHPAPLLLNQDGAILLAARCQTEEGTVHTMLYRSDDWARNWRTVGRVTDLGGTPHLLRLADGRIALTHERRRPPCSMRARVSEDQEGFRWGPEIVLRDDAAGGDIGYSRSVQRADGKVLTAYYYNVAGEGPTEAHCVRHIAGTIWDPNGIE